MSICDRGRLSRWACAAFAAAILSVGNTFASFWICGGGLANIGVNVCPLVVAVGTPPATILLCFIAWRHLHRRPYLRGKLLVELSVCAAVFAMCLEVPVAAILFVLYFMGGMD
jgi:hypothetical protein